MNLSVIYNERLIKMLTNFLNTSLEWISYSFMQYAFISIFMLSIIFALLGVLIINKRMAFFSDAYGHSTFTGLAIGSLLGVSPTLSMLIFAIIFAISINYIKSKNQFSSDTIIGVFSAAATALGLTLLSRNGEFNKFSSFLIGDILTIQPQDLWIIFLLMISILILWMFCFNKFLAIANNTSIAKSKGIPIFFYENLFTLIVAVTVVISIRIIGILLINALLILPAASSKNISSNMKESHVFAILFAIVSGILGLILSFYLKVATGPMIALISSIFFFITLFFKEKK